MPRKKRTIIDENLPDELETPSRESNIEDLVIVLSKVYKINASKRSFCFQTAEPVDEVSIQERYPAGGSFSVFEYNAQNDVVNSLTFDIEPKPMANNPAVSPQTDLQTMLMGELNWMRGMVLQMISNRGQESTPMTEIVRAVKDMHSMAGGGGKDPVDLLIKGMELGQKSSSSASGDWKSELIHTVKETAGPILNALSAPKQQPTSNGVQTVIPQTTPTTIVKQAIAWLKSKIIAGLEPGLAVDWILQNGNDPQYQPILSMAVQGTIDNFIEQDADIANEPYRTWFTTAITMIKDAYAEQSGNAGDMDGGNRDVSNVAVNEKSGSGKSKLKKVV